MLVFATKIYGVQYLGEHGEVISDYKIYSYEEVLKISNDLNVKVFVEYCHSGNPLIHRGWFDFKDVFKL